MEIDNRLPLGQRGSCKAHSAQKKATQWARKRKKYVPLRLPLLACPIGYIPFFKITILRTMKLCYLLFSLLIQLPLFANSGTASGMNVDSMILIFLLFVLVISIFLGFEIISKVPSLLHTPLMSGSNAISGITVLGALIVAGLGDAHGVSSAMGGVAIALAMINVMGGYLVTDRMLQMFKKKEQKK